MIEYKGFECAKCGEEFGDDLIDILITSTKSVECENATCPSCGTDNEFWFVDVVFEARGGKIVNNER